MIGLAGAWYVDVRFVALLLSQEVKAIEPLLWEIEDMVGCGIDDRDFADVQAELKAKRRAAGYLPLEAAVKT